MPARKDKTERRHRRTSRHPECVATMAGADFSAVPSLSEAMGLDHPEGEPTMPEAAKHSPGPWHWRQFRTMRHLFDAGGRCLKISAPIKGNKSYAPITEEDEANAELIVRAVNSHHDLLSALQGLLSVYVECVHPTCPFGEAATAEQAARAAIAKATGQD